MSDYRLAFPQQFPSDACRRLHRSPAHDATCSAYLEHLGYRIDRVTNADTPQPERGLDGILDALEGDRV
jgi:hypothetical protein